MISDKVKELLRNYFFIPLTAKVLNTLRNSSVTEAYDCLKVNFLILASFPEWKASACIISMPLLWENPPEWSEKGFTLINPQLDYSGSWCSNIRHVYSQISSWRVAAGCDSLAFFFPLLNWRSVLDLGSQNDWEKVCFQPELTQNT